MAGCGQLLVRWVRCEPQGRRETTYQKSLRDLVAFCVTSPTAPRDTMTDEDAGRKNFKMFAMSMWGPMPETVKDAWSALDTDELKAWLKRRRPTSQDTSVDSNATAGATTTGPKKMRVAKDPNAVKRPMSSYLYFCASERPRLPEGLVPTERTKELASRWKALTDAEKTVYQNMADDDKVRYQREKANVAPTGA